MAFKTIKVKIEDHISIITLHRPDALNALNAELLGELAAALKEAGENDKVRCIILTGSEKAFAAGADITEMKDLSFVDVFLSDLFVDATKSITTARKPIIAAVSGYALGGGCEVALMCDIVIAADNAKFGQPEITLGVIPGMGGTQRLARSIGKAKTMDLCLTGRLMDVQEAERCGLVARIVPATDLVEEALRTADKIANFSLPAVMLAKEAVNLAFEGPLSEGLRFERRMFHSLFATEDQSEGMEAFVQKRSPQFKNR